jgi:hypothetical protein
MSKAPSNPRLLLLVKRLFDEAKRDSAFGNKLASTKALLLLDLAVEQMLNTVISDFPSEDLVTKERVKFLSRNDRVATLCFEATRRAVALAADGRWTFDYREKWTGISFIARVKGSHFGEMADYKGGGESLL